MDNSEGIKQPNECLKDGSSNEHISIHFFIYQPNLTKSQKKSKANVSENYFPDTYLALATVNLLLSKTINGE